MEKRLLLLITLLITVTAATAQTYSQAQGAASAGIGHASITNSNAWSVFNNQATMAELRELNIGLNSNLFPQLSSNKSFALGITNPVGKNGTAGLKLYRFGNDFYSEQTAGLAFGHKISNVSLGISADYLQINVQDFGTKSTFILSFGGLVKLSDHLFLGAHIYNMNLAKMSSYQNEKVPTIMKAGISYRPYSKLMVNAEVVKDIYTKPDFRAGIEYKIIEKVPVRIGVNTLTKTMSAGAGFYTKDFRIDYAYSGIQYLSSVHSISLGYIFKSKKAQQVDEVKE